MLENIFTGRVRLSQKALIMTLGDALVIYLNLRIHNAALSVATCDLFTGKGTPS